MVAARVKRIERSTKDSDTYNLVLEGLARIRLPRSLPPVLSILPPIPLTVSTFSLPLSVISASPPTDLVPIARTLLPVQLHERLAIVPHALLSDLLVTVLNVDWEKRVELLGVPDVEERSRRVKELLLAFMTRKGIAIPPDSGSKQDMALVKSSSNALPPRSKSPSVADIAGPQGLPEDLQGLSNTLEKRNDELSSSARTAIVRELKRLVKIPPQSAEYGVGRTYVEWLLSLPWERISEVDDRLDLAEARRKLDKEHEGLEAVKRRVVEYLAVYRCVHSTCLGTTC